MINKRFLEITTLSGLKSGNIDERGVSDVGKF